MEVKFTVVAFKCQRGLSLTTDSWPRPSTSLFWVVLTTSGWQILPVCSTNELYALGHLRQLS